MPGGSDPDVQAKYQELVDNIENFGEATVNLIPVIPQLNLLRIGYLF
jgi:hypothetical protein